MSDFSSPICSPAGAMPWSGLGRNGLPAARALAAMGAEVVGWDDTAAARAAAVGGRAVARSARRDNSTSTRWCSRPASRTRCPAPHPAAARAREAGVPILSDAELLFQAVRAAGSRARFAGITGTNGKSTTTALLAHVLQQAGRVAAAGGNLGPASLALPLLAGQRRLCAGDVVLHVGANRHAPLRCRGDAQSQRRTISIATATWPDTHRRSAPCSIGRHAGDIAVIGIDDPGVARHGCVARDRPARVPTISGCASGRHLVRGRRAPRSCRADP